MRRFLQAFVLLIVSSTPLSAREDKKTDDLKPNDPDTGESTVEETTLGVLPNPFEQSGVKFAVTYIGETLGNVSGGLKRGAVYEDRFNFALDIDFEKLAGVKQLAFTPTSFSSMAAGCRAEASSTISMSAGSKRSRPRGFTNSGLSRNGARSSRCARGNWRPIPSS